DWEGQSSLVHHPSLQSQVSEVTESPCIFSTFIFTQFAFDFRWALSRDITVQPIKYIESMPKKREDNGKQNEEDKHNNAAAFEMLCFSPFFIFPCLKGFFFFSMTMHLGCCR
ncbi:unnamed protein product, partial [Ixodes persulcatus]